MYKKISDYGIIGNQHSIALIGLNGSIDWLCLPHMDSPSVFAALLDDEKGGRFAVAPHEVADSVAEYVPETNVLKTRFRTRSGVLRVTDFMPMTDENGGSEAERHELYRIASVTEGYVDVLVIFEPKFDYARGTTTLHKTDDGVVAAGDEQSLFLSSDRDVVVNGARAEGRWRLQQGEQSWLHLGYGVRESPNPTDAKVKRDLSETIGYWRRWLQESETGRTIDLGPFEEMVKRSALVLKLLYYQPTGTIAAAATASLPEAIGGDRNWDYRYTWIRDTSFTLQALFKLGHLSEMEGYLRWMERMLKEHGAANLQIMYGLRGETNLPEVELSHLDGYKGSRPVRIGNGAARQRQLDIYGEMMDAALKLSDYVGKIDFELWSMLCGICDFVVEHWQDLDSGIWEVRGGPYHFVYSKVMCWVALDRGITIARRYGFPADQETWSKTRDEIKAEVLERGWNHEKQAFVQHYETDALDASSLLLPLLGFLPFEDPRVASTVEAVREELDHEGFLYRYAAEDGLSGKEGAFLLCTFWLICCLIELGRDGEAEALLHKVSGIANHLGLFSEEYDVTWRESLGNFPQAFTHIGYVNSVAALLEARQRRPSPEARRTLTKWNQLLARAATLNDGSPEGKISPDRVAIDLKDCMNRLRGAFFNTAAGRVAYERMGSSRLYDQYRQLSFELKRFEFETLANRQEKIAFWINIYNVLVIHGVIELGIRDSVKEVWNFFKNIQYQIGDLHFTADDIEHGILRGNVRLPHNLRKAFRGSDPRLDLVVAEVDPRIHFALVCASSSCPPIEVYTAERLDEELDISGRTFLNAGGVEIQKERNQVRLSRTFKWYGRDFGRTEEAILRFIAPYLYDPDDRRFLREHAGEVRVAYQEYDWRLNRN